MRLYAAILPVLALLIAAVNCKPVVLDEKNWHLMLQGEWMIQFKAPWCTSCKNIAASWSHFAKTAAKYDVKVAVVDITKSPALSGRFLVTSLPTIYHAIDGKFRFYNGKRDNEALTNYIKLKQWQAIEPISGWSHPNSVHMAALSYFFYLSYMLKEWNALLQDEYGLSAYGSYGLFVLGTILIGGILGMVLVVLLDFVSTSKKNKKRRQFKDVNESSLEDEELTKTLIQEDIYELTEDDTKIIDMNVNLDEEYSSEVEKQDVEKDEDICDVADDDENENEDEDEDEDVSFNERDDEVEDHDQDGFKAFDEKAGSNTFVMSKNIELVPDMYEDESDEDIYHNCKLIAPVPSEGNKLFRKPVNATI